MEVILAFVIDDVVVLSHVKESSTYIDLFWAEELEVVLTNDSCRFIL